MTSSFIHEFLKVSGRKINNFPTLFSQYLIVVARFNDTFLLITCQHPYFLIEPSQFSEHVAGRLIALFF